MPRIAIAALLAALAAPALAQQPAPTAELLLTPTTEKPSASKLRAAGKALVARLALREIEVTAKVVKGEDSVSRLRLSCKRELTAVEQATALRLASVAGDDAVIRYLQPRMPGQGGPAPGGTSWVKASHSFFKLPSRKREVLLFDKVVARVVSKGYRKHAEWGHCFPLSKTVDPGKQPYVVVGGIGIAGSIGELPGRRPLQVLTIYPDQLENALVLMHPMSLTFKRE